MKQPGPQSRALRARWLWDATGGLRAGGAVVLAGGRVHQVQSRPPRDLPCLDLGEGLLMPGLVNCHCHLELSHLAGLIEPAGDFLAWLQDLVSLRPGLATPARFKAARRAAASARQSGTALLADVTNSGAVQGVARRAGLHSVAFFEALGERAAPPPAPKSRWRGGLLAARAVAAHAPYSVPAARLKALKAKAAGFPFTIHLAESRAEMELLAGKGEQGERLAAFLAHRGLDISRLGLTADRPLDYLESLGLLDPGTLLVHGIWLRPDEAPGLAASGASLCLCPRSNLGLSGALAPAAALRAAGVNLCLGTDSLASTPSLSLFEELAVLAGACPGLDPAAVLSMATLGGARALGMAEHFGRLAPGIAGPLAFVPLSGLGEKEVLSAVVAGEHGGPPRAVG